MALAMHLPVMLYVLAAALSAAHFLRGGGLILAVLCLATPLLFLVRRRWALLLLEGFAYAAALSWLWTASELVAMRRSFGQPWALAVAILVAVAALSVLAGVVLRKPRLRERYRR